jgi:hypothetical protein
VIDETPTPPVGIIGLNRATARRSQRATVPASDLRLRGLGPMNGGTNGAAPGGTSGPVTGATNGATSRLGARVPYRVVTVEDGAEWSTLEQGDGLLDLDDEQRLASWERLTSGPPLAVLCGVRDLRRVRAEAAVARSTFDAAVTVIPLANGPLGRFVGARLAAHLLADTRGRAQAAILAQLPRLLGLLPNMLLTGSVTKLDVAGIRFRHHLASHLPGTRCFAVQLTPTPGVVTVRGSRLIDPDGLIRPTDFGPAGGLALAQGSTDVPAPLLHALGAGDAVHPMRGAPDVARFWSAPEPCELVLTPIDPAGWSLTHLPPSQSWDCPWCQEPMAGDMTQCLFCGNTRR